MSDSVGPQRWQPTRLPRPWDSPATNTGVGCHFLLQRTKVKSESEVAQLCLTLSNPMDCSPPGSSIHGIFQARVLEWGASAGVKPKHQCNKDTTYTAWVLSHHLHQKIESSQPCFLLLITSESEFHTVCLVDRD